MSSSGSEGALARGSVASHKGAELVLVFHSFPLPTASFWLLLLPPLLPSSACCVVQKVSAYLHLWGPANASTLTSGS